ncbi:MAG TPA: type VI secretion system baseplate subunit TssG [Steroidobacteraceae bacterium]|nr:type VI secretion system baseplate subunit TssG [Steroidobacteraceae bacterium]
MASETGPAPNPLAALQSLLEQPRSFDFFEALRRVECAWSSSPRLATAARPADEPVRLGQTPSLAFAPTMLESAEATEGGGLKIRGYFLGLYGPHGPLPLHLTEYVHDRLTNGRDGTLAAFSDIFHHRMLSMFYRAWADARPTVHFDRPDSDQFATYVAALIGLALPALRNRDEWPDRAKLFFAGTLAAGTKTRAGLESILREYLNLPVDVIECVGEWLSITQPERLRLGHRETAVLGTSVLGERVWSMQHKVRIVIGPLDVGDLLQYLPGGASLRRLRAAVMNYLGFEYAWDLQFVVRRQRVPAVRLGQFGHLGWTSWLAPQREGADAGDVIIDVADLPAAA